MGTISVRATVECPLPQAAKRLGSFFSAHGNPAGDTARLNLQAHVPPGLPSALSVERVVIATIQPHHLPSDMTPRYRVQWAPEKPGPLPLFAGEISVAGTDDYTSFSLLLSGEYEPPGGMLGAAFDAVLGHKIAEETGNQLLASIKAFIESEFARDEGAKKTPHAPA